MRYWIGNCHESQKRKRPSTKTLLMIQLQIHLVQHIEAKAKEHSIASFLWARINLKTCFPVHIDRNFVTYNLIVLLVFLYGGYHKIKHFACHRDFFVREIPRIKHTQNALYPGIKLFEWLSLISTDEWLWNEWLKRKMFYTRVWTLFRMFYT